MSSITARCRQCGGKLLLEEIAGAHSGRCPGCGELLAPGNTLVLREEARKADVLRRAFLVCLDRLAGLPGNLELDPDAVLRDTVSALGWDERLAEDREVIRAEAARLPARTRAWRRRRRRQRRATAGPLVADIRRVAQRLRHHGNLIERRNAEAGSAETRLDPAPARAAADSADAAADAVRADRRLADDRVGQAMEEARRSLEREAQAAPRASA